MDKNQLQIEEAFVGVRLDIFLSTYYEDRSRSYIQGIIENSNVKVNGRIKKSNYKNRLYIDGTDEIYELSLLFNEMAEKLNESNQNVSSPLIRDLQDETAMKDINELKSMIIRIKNIEDQAGELISKLENKKSNT